MGSLSGILQRPLIAAAAVGVASLSADTADRFQCFRSSGTCSSSDQVDPSVLDSPPTSSWVSHISVSKLSNLAFVSRGRVPVPNISFEIGRAHV